MKKESLLVIFQALVADIKDAKTLALRVATLFIAMLSYLIIINQADLLDYVKNFSRDKIVQQVQTDRAVKYPKKAAEAASMLYTQTGASGVFVVEYTPKFINNYANIIAWEGALDVIPDRITNMVIDRASKVYQTQMLGKDTSYIFSTGTPATWGTNTSFITSGKEYTSLGIKYLYSCPIFDLSNSYSGYVGIGYKNIPYNNKEQEALLNDYLQRVCVPQARALGRAK